MMKHARIALLAALALLSIQPASLFVSTLNAASVPAAAAPAKKKNKTRKRKQKILKGRRGTHHRRSA